MVGVRGSIPLAPTISRSAASFSRGFSATGALTAPRLQMSAPTIDGFAPLSLRTTALAHAKRSKGGRALLRIFAGAALILAVAHAPAAAADAEGAVKDKHGDWVTRCETPPGAAHEQCAIVMSVVDQERPNLILVVIVLNTADRKARLMRVIAPLGVLLPPGVGLRIDDADAGRLNFLQCLPNGCIAQLAMDESLIGKLKNGKTATLGIFQTPEQGVGVQAPLAGFKEAYEQLP
jgi:invasion protein IalB